MGTRCQVKVSDGQEAVTLYHHYDGYPTNMLPVMAGAYKDAKKYFEAYAKKHACSPDYWQLGRAGHMASFLCKKEPSSFEPEAGHQLHGDIEWYYELKPDTNDKSIAADPKWNVTVYKTEGFDKGMKKIPIVEGELLKAAKMASAIEKEGNELYEKAYSERKRIKV